MRAFCRTGLSTYSAQTVDTGIPQGSPISPIFYIFYSSDLIEEGTVPEEHIQTTGYIDDNSTVAISDTAEENITKLERVHEQKAAPWARRHAAIFAPKKYQLIHFYPPYGKNRGNPYLNDGTDSDDEFTLGPTMNLPGFNIRPRRVVKYLGVLFDPELKFGAHVDHLEAKCSKRLAIFNALAASTWGLGTMDLRMIYTGTILPQFLYYASAWYQPKGGLNHSFHRKKYLTFLERVQKRAAVQITGAFRPREQTS